MRKRILTMLMAVVLLLGLFPAITPQAQAADGGQALANKALSYVGKTGPNLGFGSQNWCGYFLYKCVSESGQTGVFPDQTTLAETSGTAAWFLARGQFQMFSSSVKGNYSKLSSAPIASKGSYVPQVGDLVFFSWNGTNLSHMELVYSVNGSYFSSIGGSTGASCTTHNLNGTLHVCTHSCTAGSYMYQNLVAYARPGYSSGGSVPVSSNAAVQYALNHAYDGKGECAEFVSDCLAQININVPNTPFYQSTDYVEAGSSATMGRYTNPYKCARAQLRWLMDQGYPTVKKTGSAIEWADINVGDVVFMNDSEGNPFGHVVIITGRNPQTGESLYTAHNAVRRDEPLGNRANYVVQISRNSVGPSAPSTLSINPTSEPKDTMEVGEKFYFRGSITSNYPINHCTVSILDSNGAVVQSKALTPNKTSVDMLADGLDALSFGTLSANNGNNSYYTFLVYCTDTSGKSAEWSKAFRVKTNEPAPSTLAINITKAPEYLEKGFWGGWIYTTLSGSVTSNYKVVEITAKILDDNGTVWAEKTAKPNKTAVNLSVEDLDDPGFEDLAEGRYTIHITATDASGKTVEWTKKFTAGDVEEDLGASTLAIKITGYPEHLDVGDEFRLVGSISSNYKIVSLTQEILDADDITWYENTCSPRKTVVNLTKDDLDDLYFEELKEGVYTLHIRAEDSSGKTAEWSTKFTVGDVETPVDKVVELTIGNAYGAPGTTVQVPITLESNPGIMTMVLGIDYDREHLELLGSEDGGLTGWSVSSNAVWLGDVDSDYTGVILKLNFKILDPAEECDAIVTVTCNDGDILSHDEDAYSVTIRSGKVSIRVHTPGDVTGDGKVNALDLLRLKKLLAGEDVEIGGSADITGDGKVNALDLLRLKKYLAGEIAELH